MGNKGQSIETARVEGVQTTLPSPPSSQHVPSPCPLCLRRTGYCRHNGLRRLPSCFSLDHTHTLVYYISSVAWNYTAAPHPGPEVVRCDGGRLAQGALMCFVDFLRSFWNGGHRAWHGAVRQRVALYTNHGAEPTRGARVSFHINFP